MVNPKFLRVLSYSFLFLLLLVPFMHVPAQEAETEVRITPETLQIQPNQSGEFAVEVIDVQDLYAFDVALSFDPDLIEVQDSDPSIDGTQVGLGTFLEAGFVLMNTVDNEQGSVRFAMTQLNPAEPVDGTGILFVVRLRGKRASPAVPVVITDVQLSTNQGTEIPSVGVDGEIEIVQNLSGPTNTSIPTQALGMVQPSRTPLPNPPTATTGPSPTNTLPRSTASQTPTSLTEQQAALTEAASTATSSSAMPGESEETDLDLSESEMDENANEPGSQGSIPKNRQATPAAGENIAHDSDGSDLTVEPESKSSSWFVIGGIGLIVAIAVFGLLVLVLGAIIISNRNRKQVEEVDNHQDE